MINIDLKEILLERKFGRVELGDSVESTIAHLGEPDFRGFFDDNRYGIRYGWFEFYFEDDKLEFFMNKHALDLDYQFSIVFNYSNDKFHVATSFLDCEEDMKIKHFEHWLDKIGVNYVKKPFWDSIKLVINAETEIMFYNKQLESRDIKSQNELGTMSSLFEDQENWVFAGFYILKNKGEI